MRRAQRFVQDGTIRFGCNALGRHEIFLRFGASPPAQQHKTESERWHQIIPVKTANLIEKNVTER